MKQDIYGHENRFVNWKENIKKFGESDLTKKNSDILIQYVLDMEIGANVSNKSKKGRRSFHSLNASRQKLKQIFMMLEDRGVKDITKVSEKEITIYFDDMRNGVILTAKGTKYKSTCDYVKGFKAFYHWYMKINRKKGNILVDITEDIDSSKEEKATWAYLNEKQMKKLFKNASQRFAPFLEFLFDSGARVTESLSLVGRNIQEENGEVYLEIPNNIAKTFGRRIILKMCGKNILTYIKENNI